MCAGSFPTSIKRSTRSTSSRVLPEPLVHAREHRVGRAEQLKPRMRPRHVGRGRIVEGVQAAKQARPGRFGHGLLLAGAARFDFARTEPAGEMPVGELARRQRRDPVERAARGKSRLQRELRLCARCHLGILRHRAGLVVEHRETPVALLDPVRLRHQREGPAGQAADRVLGLHLGEQGAQRRIGASRRLDLGDEPRDAHEPRPPQRRLRRPRAAPIEPPQQRLDQHPLGLVGRGPGEPRRAQHIGDAAMHDVAEIAGIRLVVERFERLDAKHAARIERIGVGDPGGDLRDGQASRPRQERRARGRARHRQRRARIVEHARDRGEVVGRTDQPLRLGAELAVQEGGEP
jgi:hypothetical protein